MSNNEPLSFDAPPEQDVEISHSSQPTPKEKIHISSLDNLHPSMKRKTVLYRIKNGELDVTVFPKEIRKDLQRMAQLITPSPIDGTLITAQPNPSKPEEKGIKTKLDNFLITGKFGGLFDGPNSPMWINLSEKVLNELNLKYRLGKTNIDALDKSGELDKIIRFYQKQLHLDIFELPKWFKDGVKMIALQNRKEEQKNKQAPSLQESSFIEDTRNKLRQILFS